MLSVTQICDKKYISLFTTKEYIILKLGYVILEDMVITRSPISNYIYVLSMSTNVSSSTSVETCFVSKETEKDSILWYKYMGHIHVREMNQLMENNLVDGVSLKNFKLTNHCVAYNKGKHKKKSHLMKLINFIDTPINVFIWIYSVMQIVQVLLDIGMV